MDGARPPGSSVALRRAGRKSEPQGRRHGSPLTSSGRTFRASGSASGLRASPRHPTLLTSRLYPFWSHLTEALRTGEKQNEAKHGGDDFFASIYADQQRLESFLRAMSGISRGAHMRIATSFPWSKYESFVDACTAQGDPAVQVAKANPHLTGVGFDLAKVGPVFTSYVAANELSERLRFISLDLFTDDLPKADVVMMGHILHDWGLEQNSMVVGIK